MRIVTLITAAGVAGLVACSGDTTIIHDPTDTAGDTASPVDTSPVDDSAEVDSTAPDTIDPPDTEPGDTTQADMSDVGCSSECEAWERCGVGGLCEPVPCVLDQTNIGQCVLQ